VISVLHADREIHKRGNVLKRRDRRPSPEIFAVRLVEVFAARQAGRLCRAQKWPERTMSRQKQWHNAARID
jgi:hypothetical protein